MSELDREYYQRIRGRAEKDADCPGLNPSWRRAYNRLAAAADCLDAMIARSLAGSEELVRSAAGMKEEAE